MKGINLAPAVVGDVVPGKPAAKAGLKPGDEILSVNGQRNIDFIGVSFAAALSGKNEPVKMEVKKTDGSIVEISIVPEKIPEIGIKGFGIEQAATLEIAKLKDYKEMEKKLGLKPGDVLTAVNDQPIEHFWEYSQIINDAFEPNVVLSFKRDDQERTIHKNFKLEYSSALVFQDNGPFVPTNVYGLVPRIKVQSVQKDK
jgi:regulator of sigma E protease